MIYNIIRVIVGMLREYFLIGWLQIKDRISQKPPSQWQSGERGVVILLPGYIEGLNFMRAIGDRVNKLGYQVIVPADIHWFESAKSQAKKVQDIMKQIPEGQTIDIVGHSMGGLVGKLVLIDHPERIRNLLTIGTPWAGSWFGYGRFCGLWELRNNSPLIQELHSHSEVNHKITSINPYVDNHVLPNSSLDLQGEQNIKMKVIGHTVILFDPATLELVASKLS